MMKIGGIEESTGVYEGNAYDNVKFNCKEPFESGKGVGEKYKVVKVKRKVLNENFEKHMTLKELGAFVGKEVTFFYDEFQNVMFVQIQQEQTAKG
jgi:hypothetical protein